MFVKKSNILFLLHYILTYIMTIILTKDGIKNTRRIVIDNSLNMSRIVNDNNILEFHTQGLRLPRFDNTFHQNYNFVDTSQNGAIYLDDSDDKFKFVQNENRVTVDNSNFDNGVSSISLGDNGKSILFNVNGTDKMKMDASGVHLNDGSAFITHPQDGLITGNIGIEDKIVFYNSNNVETSQMHYDSSAIIFESSNNHFDLKVGSGKIIMTIQDNEILHINSTGIGHNLNGNLPSNTLDISGNVSINYTGNSILNNKYLYSKGGIGIGVTCETGQSLNINNKCIVETNGDISFSDLSCNYIRVNDLKPQELLFDDGNDSSFNITNRLVFSTKTNNHNTLFRATNANNDDAYYFSTYNNNFSLYSNGYHRIFGDSIKMIEYNKESNESMIIGPTSYDESNLFDLNSNTIGLNWKITDCSFGFKTGGWNSDNYSRSNIGLLTNAKFDTITHYKSNAFDISSDIIQNKYDNLVMNVTNSTTKKFIFNNDLEISGNLTINSGVINITRNNVYIYSEFSINSTSNPSIELNKNTVDSGYYLQASKNNEIKVNVSKLGMGVSPDGNNSTSASSDYVLDVSGEVYGLYPVGSVIMLEPTQSVPSGWALCDGSTLTRNSYVDLSNVIGSKYGGNATTINLPNFNDSMPMGNPDPESGTTFESQSGSNEITENHMPSHTHDVNPDDNFDISLNKTNMKFGNTLFTQEIYDGGQEHANWQSGDTSLNDIMNVETNNNSQGLKYITKTSQTCTGRDGNQGNNTVNKNAINTEKGVFKGRTQPFPIHHGITVTNTNNNSGADFIPSYATIKFIIYHGVH